MRSIRRAGLALALASALALLGGCGPADSQAEGDAPDQAGTTSSADTPTSPAASPTDPGTAPPTTGTGGTDPDIPIPDLPRGAPRTPTDMLPSNVLAGTIRGGDPACYTMETDDNKSYALLGVHGDSLAAGVLVVVTIADQRPATAPCVGDPVSVLKLETV